MQHQQAQQGHGGQDEYSFQVDDFLSYDGGTCDELQVVKHEVLEARGGGEQCAPRAASLLSDLVADHHLRWEFNRGLDLVPVEWNGRGLEMKTEDRAAALLERRRAAALVFLLEGGDAGGAAVRRRSAP